MHWAKDGDEHNRIVLAILREAGARTLIKSKSMLTEECGMREFLVESGIDVTETDLGERIQQLDNEAPSHVVVPSVHKLRSDVAEVFARTLGTEPGNDDPQLPCRTSAHDHASADPAGGRRTDRRQFHRRRDGCGW